MILVLDALLSLLRLTARHTSPDALAAFAHTHFAETFIHVTVFLTSGHEGKACHAADCLIILLNGCLDRRDIDLAISACLGRHKKSSFLNKNHFLSIFSSTKKASTVIGTGFQAGDPREIRTPDTLIRSQVLYPAELLGHVAGAEGLKPPTYGFGDRCSINCAMPLSV